MNTYSMCQNTAHSPSFTASLAVTLQLFYRQMFWIYTGLKELVIQACVFLRGGGMQMSHVVYIQGVSQFHFHSCWMTEITKYYKKYSISKELLGFVRRFASFYPFVAYGLL